MNLRWRPQLSDPKDELVLEVAVNGGADTLVTHNLRDFEPATRVFGLRVLLPRDALKELRRWSKSTYPLEHPTWVKMAAAKLAKADGCR